MAQNSPQEDNDTVEDLYLRVLRQIADLGGSITAEDRKNAEIILDLIKKYPDPYGTNAMWAADPEFAIAFHATLLARHRLRSPEERAATDMDETIN